MTIKMHFCEFTKISDFSTCVKLGVGYGSESGRIKF